MSGADAAFGLDAPRLWRDDDDGVFDDPVSAALLRQVRAVASTEGDVLLTGEPGSGRTRVARLLHAASRRAAGPFIEVDCGAGDPGLAEAGLFGHEKGAFAGVFSPQAGGFEAAHGGTLFLVGIDALSLPLQARLMHALQSGEVTRPGSRGPVPSDVRLVAATAVRLEDAVAAGRFRDDLCRRLGALRLAVPALRDRPGDIVPLTRRFMADCGRRLGLGVAWLSEAAERKLLHHPWPGNLRELENAIHHALVRCRGGLVDAHDLVLTAGPVVPDPEAGLPLASSLLEQALDGLFREGGEALFERIEEAVLRRAYRHCQRNQVQTARLLGLSRNVVRARLAKIGEIASVER